MKKNEKNKRYDLKQINDARRMSGLKEISVKVRSCLRCGREFVSEGDHNRLCDFCRKFSMRDQSEFF